MRADPAFALLSGVTNATDWSIHGLSAGGMTIAALLVNAGAAPLTCALLCPYHAGLNYRPERSRRFAPDSEGPSRSALAHTLPQAGLSVAESEDKGGNRFEPLGNKPFERHVVASGDSPDFRR